MKCEIVSPEKTLYNGEADAVLLPSVNGQLGILPGHLPLLAMLEAGIITVRLGNNEEKFTISAGFAHVEGNCIRVISEASENIANIDVARAREAKERAIKEMASIRKSDSPEFLAAMMKLKRSELRLKAVGQHGSIRKKPLR